MNAMTWVTAVAVATAVGAMTASAARVDEENAKSLLKAMSDYMGSQQAISFDYDSNLEIVTRDNQKIGLASSGSMVLNRPNKIHGTRTGGFANIEFAFDGKTLTLLGKNANVYAQLEAPGTIDQLVDELRDKYQRPVPAADLLMANVYDQLMPSVVDAKDLGSGVVAGVECDHLAFRSSDVDWQIWIAQGSSPYPCRYVITSTGVPEGPQYTIDVRSWKTGTEVRSDAFAVQVPNDGKKLSPNDIPDLDELPGIFRIGQ